MTEGNKVAIVGLGALGIVALKNCLEEGFEATGFDRIPYPGGLWTYTPEDRVSALPILPRVKEGEPVDHTINVRYVTWQRVFERFFPSLVEKLFNNFGKRLQDEAFNIRPEWKLSPAPSLKKYLPLITDNLIDSLESGAVLSVEGVSGVVGPNKVELTDGKVIKVDTIIYCTGYMSDFSLLDPKYDPTRETTPDWAAARGSRGKPLPRLYQGVFSLSHPHSLAFQGAVALTMGQFQINDLSSMAVTQVWKGRSALPPQEEMEQAVDKHHAWIVEPAQEGSVLPQTVNPYQWADWANQTAGTGVNEYLGWGWKGWKFWFQEPRFCSVLMGGVYSPHIYRVFDGKRKRWGGARTEIERLYKVANEKPKVN
ncbi:Monooxygenase aurF [Colletotrichum fructicola]|nr:Monooxygenase aurF [Colletotrichum fructicola]